MTLTSLIRSHYTLTEKVYPDTWQALAWAITELGEAFELLLNEDPPGWVRNHPDEKEPYSPERLEEELGDVMMRVQVAGMVRGLDPFSALVEKISPPGKEKSDEKKLEEWHNGIPGDGEPLTDLPLFKEEK